MQVGGKDSCRSRAPAGWPPSISGLLEESKSGRLVLSSHQGCHQGCSTLDELLGLSELLRELRSCAHSEPSSRSSLLLLVSTLTPAEVSLLGVGAEGPRCGQRGAVLRAGWPTCGGSQVGKGWPRGSQWLGVRRGGLGPACGIGRGGQSRCSGTALLSGVHTAPSPPIPEAPSKLRAHPWGWTGAERGLPWRPLS